MIDFTLPTINGYQVIGVFKVPKREHERDGRVLLIHRPENPVDKFVVCYHFESDDEWHQGTYVRTFGEAWTEFNMRIMRCFS